MKKLRHSFISGEAGQSSSAISARLSRKPPPYSKNKNENSLTKILVIIIVIKILPKLQKSNQNLEHSLLRHSFYQSVESIFS